MKTIITKMSIIGLIVLMMASCKKDPEMPSGEFVYIIETNEVTDVTAVSAVVSAYVGGDCDERGVCWSESANPTIDDFYVSNGKGKGDYTCLLTNLTPNKKYYCKAYGKCGTKYVYSRQTKNFTTNDAIAGHEYVDLGLPSGLLWATCNVGADSPEDYGWYFIWGSTTSGGDPDCSWVNCPGNGGSSDYNSSAIATWDNSNLTNNVLKPDVDAASVSWGGDWRMPTNTEWQELINHTNCTWTTENGVYGRKFEGDNGNYVFLPAAGLRDGTILVYAGPCAFYWSSSLNSSNPIFACNVYFVSGIELYPKYRNGYRYFGFSVRPVRAQSISAPAVTTSSVSNITQATATYGGNVTSDGGANVTARGICWSTSQNPTVSNSHTTNGSGTGSFTSNITGLTANTTYYVRAYATNSKGTSYGEQKSFTTLSQPQTFTVNGVTFEMIAVKGGTFTMGGTSEQGSYAGSNEFPTHSVTLSDYYIGKFEVTQELWVAVMGSNPSYFNGSNLPVEQVSWNDCQEFVTKLNGLTGKNFRLPTEAEWEYAARGGNRSGGYKYSGSNNINDVAWYSDNGGSKTHAVGTKSPNELGIYDMSGNVWEWCQDWYGSYSSGSQTNPQGPSSGPYRVNRGGGWNIHVRFCRVSFRFYDSPFIRIDYLGLRLAL